jgi:three-Cys-motif partner protein
MPTGDLVLGSDGYQDLMIGPWAKEKLFYIQNYCDIFNTGMRGKWAARTYIDLFAGSGRCVVEGTQEEIDGSPLIALHCKVPFTHYFFNDSNEGAIESLKSRVMLFDSNNINFFTRDCNEVIEELRSKLPDSSLDFCFIDPLNWEIKFDSIRKLTKNRSMDLAITFHVGAIKRVMHDPPDELNDFFGDKLWYDECRSGKSGSRGGVGRAILDAYEKRLRGLGYIHLQDYLPVRNTKSVVMYYLISAFKHPRGKDFWDKISQRMSTGQRRLF